MTAPTLLKVLKPRKPAGHTPQHGSPPSVESVDSVLNPSPPLTCTYYTYNKVEAPPRTRARVRNTHQRTP